MPLPSFAAAVPPTQPLLHPATCSCILGIDFSEPGEINNQSNSSLSDGTREPPKRSDIFLLLLNEDIDALVLVTPKASFTKHLLGERWTAISGRRTESTSHAGRTLGLAT